MCHHRSRDNRFRGRPSAVTSNGTLADNDEFVRELHHRVKNNFQTIASLIHLQKRVLPHDRRGEVRFVEEQVQSMAAAYRIATVANGIVQLALRDLVSDVIDELRQIAGVNRDRVVVELPASDCCIRMDQAVSIGLYLALLVPPYLDAATAPGGTLRVAVTLEDPAYAVLSIGAAREAAIASNPLRRRLTAAFGRQLSAEMDPTIEPGALRVRIRLLPLEATDFLAPGPNPA
jgi:hypothetical protein